MTRPVRIPFATTSDCIDYARIGDGDKSFIYLLKRGDVCPNEDAEELHVMAARRSRSTALYFKAIEAYRQVHKCTHQEARKRFFGTTEEPSQPEPGTEVETLAIAPVETSAIVPVSAPVETPETPDLYDWLGGDDIAQLIELENSSAEVPIHVATLFIQLRLLYPVVVTADAVERSNMIQCEPLNFLLSRGDVIRVKRRRVVVVADADYDDTVIEVEPLKFAIAAQDVGFLLDGRSEKQGDPTWSFDMTRNYLTTSQIESIYRFYREEDDLRRSRVEGNLTPSTQNQNSKRSSNTQPQSQQTGKKSTGGSKATDSTTHDLIETTSGSNPAG